MTRALPLLIALVLATSLASAQDSRQAPADQAVQGGSQQEVLATYGDWSKICAAGENDERVCQIVQSANQNDTGRLVFQTAVGYVSDNERPIMYLTAPLGIFLPRGISVFVDDAEEGLTATVQRCDANGCLAVLALEDTFVTQLKRGAEAKLVFAANAQQNVSLPMSLTGFTRAFDSLERPASSE